MSDVLSQNEIDDLLNALSTGEVNVKEIEEESNEKKVRKYDFSRPDKFAKDQLRTLEIIHENWNIELSVQHLAKQVHLSQNYFGEQFKDTMGLTIQQYINTTPWTLDDSNPQSSTSKPSSVVGRPRTSTQNFVCGLKSADFITPNIRCPQIKS